MKTFRQILTLRHLITFPFNLDALKGLVTVVFVASDFSVSLKKLAETIDDLSAYIKKKPDASATLTHDLDPINCIFDDLISGANAFTESTFSDTDKDHNLNFFKIENILDGLKQVTRAQYDLSAAIKKKLSGPPPDGSSTDLEEFVGKMEAASVALDGFSRAADNVAGVSSLFFGVAAIVLFIVKNLKILSESLYKLAEILSIYDLVSALKDLAKAYAGISAAFLRLAKLT